MLELSPFYRRNVSFNPTRELNGFGFPFDFFDSRSAAFNTDITDNGDSFLLEADLPGFAKENIDLNIDGDLLTVKAVRHSAHEEKDKKDRYIRCERSYGSYTRQFDISEIDAENISAKYEDGVLKLTLPKKAAPAPTAKKLTIA